MESKRKSTRVDRAFEVRHSFHKKHPTFGYTVSKNISRGGLCIPVPSRSVRKDDLVSLSIKTTDHANLVAATGKVKWIKKQRRRAILDGEAGIEFTTINPEDIERLLKK